MGMTPQFPLSCKEVKSAIDDYRRKVGNGEYKRADFWHFCGVIGVDAQTVVDVIKSPNKRNEDTAAELKKFVTWVQGEYMTAPAWNGPAGGKAIFALKQNLGGMVLTDRQDVNASGSMMVNVKFGGKSKDPFG